MNPFGEWALAIAYWLHMAATVFWIGGLVFQGLILFPILADPKLAASAPSIHRSVRRRFAPLTWICLAVLIGTGLVQMSASTQYSGLLSVANRWSVAILAKHLTVLAMLALAAYQTWWLGPKLEREVWRTSNRETTDTGNRLTREASRIVGWNFLLSLAVLAFTALARVS